MRIRMQNRKTLSALLVLALLTLPPISLVGRAQQIPAHPRDLKYTTLNYTPPTREQYRHVLSNGAVAYLVEDHDLPLVNVSTLVRTGSYLDPAGKEGLASLTGAQMRAGGTTSKTAEEFDEAADFLAANISSFIGPTQGNASVNLLAKDIDQGLGLYLDMLKNPRFQEDRIKLAKSAAPPEISDHATVYVLDKTGYVKVQDGTNGFSCFVDRQTPFNLEPTCFDVEGSASTLPTRFYAEEQRAQGKSEEEIKAAIDNGYKSGKFHAPAKPGIVYMLSDQGVLFISGKSVHIPPHLMFYAPYATDKDIGSPPAAANMPRLIRAGQPDASRKPFNSPAAPQPLCLLAASQEPKCVSGRPAHDSRNPRRLASKWSKFRQ